MLPSVFFFILEKSFLLLFHICTANTRQREWCLNKWRQFEQDVIFDFLNFSKSHNSGRRTFRFNSSNFRMGFKMTDGRQNTRARREEFGESTSGKMAQMRKQKKLSASLVCSKPCVSGFPLSSLVSSHIPKNIHAVFLGTLNCPRCGSIHVVICLSIQIIPPYTCPPHYLSINKFIHPFIYLHVCLSSYPSIKSLSIHLVSHAYQAVLPSIYFHVCVSSPSIWLPMHLSI